MDYDTKQYAYCLFLVRFGQKESVSPFGITLDKCIKVSVPLFYRLIIPVTKFRQLFLF